MDYNAVYIEKVDTNHAVRVYTQIGRRAPLYAGACLRIFLAFPYAVGIQIKTVTILAPMDMAKLLKRMCQKDNRIHKTHL